MIVHRLLLLTAFALAGINNYAWVSAVPIRTDLRASRVPRARAQAPKITCDIRLRYWCIVQADAKINMADEGDDRVWRISATGMRRDEVEVRESKTCDSPSEYQPRKVRERDEGISKIGVRHVSDFTVTADGACRLTVAYPAGAEDWAREARQIANYRLFFCNDGACRTRVLGVK